jgi:NAD(P)-dependent dehydrogenase (short-subunit alcohol dehydrogenase family)
MELSLARHAFITGGASGIGLAIADALAKRGVSVTIADIDRQALDSVLKDRPKGFHGIALDTRDRDGWRHAKRSVETVFGPVDILVNNAGIAPDGFDLADMDPVSFDRIIAINLTGVFNGVSTFAADMRSRRTGHIVNTSSIIGLTAAMPTIGGYTVAKFGVVALSEVLRKEMMPHGVGVSVLCPGVVATNLRDSTIKVGGSVRDPNASMTSGGMDAAIVGEITVEGISRNLPYIITHPEGWRGVEARMNDIRDAFLSHPSGPSATTTPRTIS